MLNSIGQSAAWFLGVENDDEQRPSNITRIGIETTEAWGPIEDRGEPCDTPFPFNPNLNLRVLAGNILHLEADATVVFEDSTTLNGPPIGDAPAAVLRREGGYEYNEDLLHILRDRLRSGDARMSKAPQHFPMDRIIHTVGPKFKEKYSIAAQNTLSACLRESLQLCSEEGSKVVAMPMIYSRNNDFPNDLAAHTTLRTVRRWMEKLNFDTIVFVGTQEDAQIFCPLLPLYFPRSHEEALYMLPHMANIEIGNATGEVDTKEREIRLGNASFIQENDESSSTDTLDVSFLQKTDGPNDFDEECRKRLDITAWEAENPEEVSRVYHRYLRESQKYDFSHFIKRGFLICEEVHGRKVVVILGHRFPAEVDAKKMILFVISYLDPKIKDRYSLLYVHTNVSFTEHGPSWNLFCELMRIFTTMFTSTLERVVILHPDFMFKTLFSVAAICVAGTLWPGALYAENVLYLKQLLGPVPLPEYVLEYDRSLY